MKLLFEIKILLFVLLLHTYIPAIAQLEGKVIGIADGDTFTLLTKEKQQVRIRVYGIDCPKYKQDFGQVARKFTSDFIYKKQYI